MDPARAVTTGTDTEHSGRRLTIAAASTALAWLVLGWRRPYSGVLSTFLTWRIGRFGGTLDIPLLGSVQLSGLPTPVMFVAAAISLAGLRIPPLQRVASAVLGVLAALQLLLVMADAADLIVRIGPFDFLTAPALDRFLVPIAVCAAVAVLSLRAAGCALRSHRSRVSPIALAGEQYALASNGRRFIAYLLDCVIAVITLGIGAMVWALTLWGRGKTPGKQLVGLRVITTDGQPMTFGRMALRELVGKGFIGMVTCGTSSIASGVMVLAGRNRQGLWDLMASTVVIDEQARPRSADGHTSGSSLVVSVESATMSPEAAPSVVVGEDSLAKATTNADCGLSEVAAVVQSMPHASAPFSQEPKIRTPAADADDDRTQSIGTNAPTARPLRLHFDDGTVLTVSNRLIIGREPGHRDDARTHTLTDPDQFLSKAHVELVAEAGTLLISDLGSTNGTVIRLTTGEIKELSPHHAHPLKHGNRVVIGGRWFDIN